MKPMKIKHGILVFLLGSSLTFGNVIAGFQVAGSQDLASFTPRQVVEQWHLWYPGKIEKAAEMTTMSFREGVSKQEWIATQKPFLQNLGMKYVRAKVVNEEISEKKARVIVQAHITTVMGDHPQDELYELLQGPNGNWLIDRIEVYTESFNSVP